MAYYYLKLHHDTLRDRKMGMLSDHLYRRVIEIFLMASEQPDRDGNLPSVEDMAYEMRTTPELLTAELTAIQEQTNIVQLTDAGWFVTNFVKRQASNDPTAPDRMRRFRERNASVTDKENVTDVTRNVTRDVTRRVKNLDTKENTTDLNKKEIKRTATGINAREKTAAAVFTKFQNDVQPLTPGASDVIGDWIDTYPEQWIIDAIQEAVNNNARRINYIDAILKNWQSNGRNAPKPARAEKQASETY